METVTLTLPAHWASYLINGDDSSLDTGERAAIYRMTGDYGNCLDMVKGSEHFTWSFATLSGRYVPPGATQAPCGGLVADYVFPASR